MRKNVASQFVAFQAVSTTDGSAVTTGTPAVYYTIDGGTEGTGSGACVHEGHGTWSYACAQAETNGNHVVFTFVLSGAVSQTVNVYPVGYDETAANVPSDVIAISGDTTAANNAESFFDGTGYAGTNNVIPTVTTLTGHTAQTGDCYARLGAPAGASHAADVAAVKADTAAILDDTGTSGVLLANGSIKTGTFNAGAINAAAIAADAIGASELAADAVTEIVAGVWGALTASYTGIGTFGLLLSSTNNAAQTINGDWTDGQRLDLILDAIKAKTDYLPSTTAGAAGGVFIAGSNAATTVNITGTVSGNSTHSAADVKTAIEAAGSHLTLILEDTGTTLPSTLSTILTDTDELQKAITDGGRTDLLIDAIKAKTDAMLDAAATRTAVGLASANLDTQLSGINSKTTNLPSDPAGQSAVEAAIAAVQSHGDSTWATATSVMVSDKAGFKLASDGLDSVATTAPTGPAANFREMIVQTWRRFFKRSTRTYSGGTQQIVTYADNGTTPVTTQTISDDGTTETQGVAS